ncbi:protein NPC2 homolog [Trichogramma pretiosum]|uniref:protein NPC2 homolog n=1 Tax=Trichogramma pretiosum TaxID=7493 RepID=UPI0006C9B2EA|nr:protein NPC2 homolog [Trichogramma pretiosum]
MTKAIVTLAVCALLVALASATRVNECKSGKAIEDTTKVQITNCETPPCKLKKRTKVQIVQRFTPNRDVQSVKTAVYATILGVPLPFVGVDGTDACGKVFNAADGSPAPCPLKKGVEYLYKNEFPILPIYPTVQLVVHWALEEPDKKVVACFEVPSRITV